MGACRWVTTMVLALLLASVLTSARAGQGYRWMGEPEPAWFPRVLATIQANRGWRFDLKQAGLFEGSGGRLYLLLGWSYEEDRSHWEGVEFHRVEIGAGETVHLTFLRQLWNIYLDFGEPVSIPGEAPAVVVRYDGNGSWSLLRGVRIIQLARNTVDITPDNYGQTVWFGHKDSFDPGGSAEVVARPFWFGVDDTGTPVAEVIDSRWTNLYSGAGGAGPFVSVVLERVAGAWKPACRHFPMAYKPFFIRDPAVPRELEHDEDWASLLAQSMFAHMQFGQLDEAHRDLEHLLAFNATSTVERSIVNGVDPMLPEILEDAQLHRDESCVLALIRDGDRMDSSYLPIPATQPPGPSGQGPYDYTD